MMEPSIQTWDLGPHLSVTRAIAAVARESVMSDLGRIGSRLGKQADCPPG